MLSPALAPELLTPQIDAGERVGGLSQLGLGPFLGGAGPASRLAIRAATWASAAISLPTGTPARAPR